jgi:hypothetical protein
VDVSKANWPAVVEHTRDEWVLAHAADTAYPMGRLGERYRAWSSGWREVGLPAALTPVQTQLLRAAAVRELPDAAVRRWAAEGGTLPPLLRDEAATAAAAAATAEAAAAAGGACSAEELAAVPTGRGGVASQLQ